MSTEPINPESAQTGCCETETDSDKMQQVGEGHASCADDVDTGSEGAAASAVGTIRLHEPGAGEPQECYETNHDKEGPEDTEWLDSLAWDGKVHPTGNRAAVREAGTEVERSPSVREAGQR
jgi:hypothetical protein